MTNEAQTHKIKLDEAYKDEAFKRVQDIVAGNKLGPDDVKLEKFEGEMLNFEAQTTIIVKPKTSIKTVAGRVSGPIKVDSDIVAHEEIAKVFRILREDSPAHEQIKSTLLTRPDKGLGAGGTTLDLPFWKKEYVVFRPCLACRNTGNVKCLPCDGKGMERCPRCNGIGLSPCTQCNGTQTVQGPNNRQVQCTMCQGSGKTSCVICNQAGRITCKSCRNKGETTCPTCNGNAWSSEIFICELKAITHFEYPHETLPEQVVSMIDKEGLKIADHAKIIIPTTKHTIEEPDRDDLQIPVIYDITLPYAHMEYEIEGKTYYTFLFGKTGALEHVSPFLDDILQNGIRKLSDGANSRGDVSDSLRVAAEYKTLRQGITYAAQHSLAKAKQKLLSSNPLGLSDEAAVEIVTNADKSLKNITKKPRTTGLMMSALFNATFFAVYFLSPLRQAIVSKVGNASLHFVLDGIILGAICYIGAIIIQTKAQAATKAIMHDIIPKQDKAIAPARLGETAYWNIAASGGAFLIMVELSRHIAAHPVAWWASLFG